MNTRLVVWCAGPMCGTQITGFGFIDSANPPTSTAGPWLCLFCAREAHRLRPNDITQAFTTEPVAPGSTWRFQ